MDLSSAAKGAGLKDGATIPVVMCIGSPKLEYSGGGDWMTLSISTLSHTRAQGRFAPMEGGDWLISEHRWEN